MKVNEKRQFEKATALDEMLTPLGFVCEGPSRFRHPATTAVFDFSAANPELKDIITVMLKRTAKLYFAKGSLDARTAFAALFDTEEIKESIDTMEMIGF